MSAQSDYDNELLKLHQYMRMTSVPVHMREALFNWIVKGDLPGHFLSALLANDLKATYERADHINVISVRNYIDFLYNHAPSGCWGSVENFKSWRGLATPEQPTEEKT